MFNIQAFGVIIIQHWQAICPCEQDKTTDRDRLEQWNQANLGLRDSCSVEFPSSCAGQVPVGPLEGPWKFNWAFMSLSMVHYEVKFDFTELNSDFVFKATSQKTLQTIETINYEVNNNKRFETLQLWQESN